MLFFFLRLTDPSSSQVYSPTPRIVPCSSPSGASSTTREVETRSSISFALLRFCFPATSTRCWRRWRVGTRFFWSFPTSTTSDPAAAKVSWEYVSPNLLALLIFWWLVCPSRRAIGWSLMRRFQYFLFVLFCMVQFLQSSGPVMIDCKHVWCGVCSNWCVLRL